MDSAHVVNLKQIVDTPPWDLVTYSPRFFAIG